MSIRNELSLDFWTTEHVDEDFIDDDDEAEIDHVGMIFDDIEDDEKFDEFPPKPEKDKKNYIGRDETTKWMKNRNDLPWKVKEKCESKIACVKPAAMAALTPLDAWNLLIDEKMLKDILAHTNSKIRLKTAYFDADYRYQAGQTTITEFKALLGLLYLAGIFRPAPENLEELWNDTGTGIEIFRLTMSYFRFTFLISFVSFDDFPNRSMLRKNDTLAPVRKVLERFLANCQNSYEPSEHLIVERKFEKFLGPCPFRNYMKKMREKYGIMFFRLIDGRTNYLQNMEIYCNKHDEANRTEKIKNRKEIFDIVDRLVVPISRTSRNVILDENITSYDIVVNLSKKHNLKSIGRGKSTEKEIPICFSRTNVERENSTIFGFREYISLLSYYENGENFLLYSNGHIEAASINDNEKPEILHFYDSTKKTSKEMDEIPTNYDVSRKTRRWPLAIFFKILNYAGINSQIIYKINGNDRAMKRRDYLKELARGLVLEHLQNRKKNQRLPREIRQKIGKYFGDPIESARKRRNVHGRCALCPRERDRKSFYGCANCQRYICLEHAIFYCEECCGTCDED